MKGFQSITNERKMVVTIRVVVNKIYFNLCLQLKLKFSYHIFAVIFFLFFHFTNHTTYSIICKGHYDCTLMQVCWNVLSITHHNLLPGFHGWTSYHLCWYFQSCFLPLNYPFLLIENLLSFLRIVSKIN